MPPPLLPGTKQTRHPFCLGPTTPSHLTPTSDTPTDPRVEARNAPSKLEYLYSLVNLDRSELPWGQTNAEADRSAIWEEPLRDDSRR